MWLQAGVIEALVFDCDFMFHSLASFAVKFKELFRNSQ
jgi:hypothetical protein